MTNGRLTGAITDGLGTLRAFEQANVSLEDKSILFVGTGGAARAVAFAMTDACRPRESPYSGTYAKSYAKTCRGCSGKHGCTDYRWFIAG